MKAPAEPSALADSDDEDIVLGNSEVLSQEEVLRRRARRLKRLIGFYKDCYWDLMEDVRRKHREYYWKYGMSPFLEDEGEERENGVLVENHVNGNGNALSNGDHRNHGDVVGTSGDKLGLGSGGSFKECIVDRCRTKAMPLTKYCHPHILLDSKQTLYKRCKFVFKRTGSCNIVLGSPSKPGPGNWDNPSRYHPSHSAKWLTMWQQCTVRPSQDVTFM